jgi:hypothetical protein
VVGRGLACWLAQHASNSPSEDTVCVEEIGTAAFVGVFDGHGGHECAAYTAAELVTAFRQRYKHTAVGQGGRRSIDSLRAKFFEPPEPSGQPSSTAAVGATDSTDAASQLAAAFVDCDKRWLSQCAEQPRGSGGRNLARAGACALACCK